MNYSWTRLDDNLTKNHIEIKNTIFFEQKNKEEKSKSKLILNTNDTFKIEIINLVI